MAHASTASRHGNSDGHRPKEILLMLLAILITPTTAQLYYYVGCYTARTDLLNESLYAQMPQTCIDICELKNHSYAVLAAEQCFCTNLIAPEDRQDAQLCNTRCLANKSQYCGGAGVHSYYSTKFATDDGPALRDLRLINATENSLNIGWEAREPTKMPAAGAEAPPVQTIMNFLIKTEMISTFAAQPFFPPPEFIVQNTERSFEITDLHPATQYNVTVEALCKSTSEHGTCGSLSIVGSTVIGQPSPPPPQPQVLASSDSSITVQIKPIRNDNGPVTKVLVIVERIDESLSQPFDADLLGSWRQAQEDGLPYYIAAELDYDRPGDNRTRQFIVGDGKRYGRYTNPPVDNKNAHLHVSLGVISTMNGVTKALYTHSTHEQHTTNTNSMDNFVYATFDAGRQSLIALTVTCVVFGVCLVLSVVAYFYLRYKTHQRRCHPNNSHEMTMQQPIIERENNGFVVEDDLPATESFKEQLNSLLQELDTSKRIPRSALRLNVNDVVAEGRYGEVITGKVLSHASSETSADCQLHILALDDLSSSDQAHLLREFRNLTRLQTHPHILDFFGVSASSDWFYFIFEHQAVSLKRRLVESRRAPNNSPVKRLTTLSEQQVLQWIFEIASAMEYLGKCRVVHKQLCSHNIFLAADAKLKLSVFGPIPYISNQKKVDLSRWSAPEVLRHQRFSSKSDVWSFACVAWECCSLGATLYPNISNSQQLLDAIKNGSRPAQPLFVYRDLYQILLNCWTLEPSERSDFEEIALNVRQLMTASRHALCFDRQTERPGNGNGVLDTLPFYFPMLEVQI